MQGPFGGRSSYSTHATNHCPSCGQSQWIVGRIMAECACCGDALPINAAVRLGARKPRPETLAA